MHETQHLRFDVHLDNGGVFYFEQDDSAAISQALQRLQPSRVFEEEQLVVAGGTHTTTFSTRAILYIHLQFDVAPNWSFRSNIRDVQQITSEQFAAVVAEQKQRERALTESFEAHAEMNLRDGASIYLRIRGETLPMSVQSRSVIRILEQPSLIARSFDGGFLIVHPSNVSSVAVYPGPPKVPSSAVHAHFAEGPRRSSDV